MRFAFHLLGQKFVVLRLELLNNVLVVQQFFDGAVVFRKQVLDWGATVLAVGLPEVTVEESTIGHKKPRGKG